MQYIETTYDEYLVDGRTVVSELMSVHVDVIEEWKMKHAWNHISPHDPSTSHSSSCI